MKYVAMLLLCSCVLLANGEGVDETKINALIQSIKAMAENLTDEASEYSLLAEMSKLRSEMQKNQLSQDMEKSANAALKTANEALTKKSTDKLAEIIKNTRPLTAVLFSSQDRNSYEVVKNPADRSKGIINQNQTGDTGGILIAAEAPLFYPNPMKKSVIPVGAWFGVRMQAGGGSDVSGVDLAAGISLSYISGHTISKLNTDKSVTESARLLFGAIYGEVATLGAGLTVGSPFELGEEIPINREKDIAFTIGLGFRF